MYAYYIICSIAPARLFLPAFLVVFEDDCYTNAVTLVNTEECEIQKPHRAIVLADDSSSDTRTLLIPVADRIRSRPRSSELSQDRDNVVLLPVVDTCLEGFHLLPGQVHLGIREAVPLISIFIHVSQARAQLMIGRRVKMAACHGKCEEAKSSMVHGL